MFGKIIDGKLVIAGRKVQIDNGWITNPTEEQLRNLGYKEIEYTERPSFDDEEEKLQEVYTDGATIVVSYGVVALTDEEHNEVIKNKIVDEESKITERNKLDYMIDNDSEALKRIQKHRVVIAELRTKLRRNNQEQEQ